MIFSTNFFWNILTPQRIQSDIIVTDHRSSYIVPVIPVRIKWLWNFLNKFSQNPLIIKFHGNPSSRSSAVPCGACEQRGWRYNFASAAQIIRLSGTMMCHILAQQYAVGGGWSRPEVVYKKYSRKVSCYPLRLFNDFANFLFYAIPSHQPYERTRHARTPNHQFHVKKKRAQDVSPYTLTN